MSPMRLITGTPAPSRNIKAKKAHAANELEDEVEYQAIMALN